MSPVELYREPTGRWRWAYRASEGSKPLPSNEDYDGEDAARAASQAAFPGEPIVRAADEVGTARVDRSTGGGFPRKVANWLTPVVVLLAWARRRR